MKKMNKFRIAAKTLFVTYLSCNLSPLEVLSELQTKFPVIEYLIVRENLIHNSVNIDSHFYCLVKCNKKVDTISASRLDLSGKFHGKYEGVKNEKNTLNYILEKTTFENISKDKVVMSLYYQDMLNKHSNVLITKENKDSKVLTVEESMLSLARAGKIAAAMEILEKEKPHVFLKSHMLIERSLKDLYVKSIEYPSRYDPIKDFVFPSSLMDTFNECLENNLSFYVFGSSGFNKTYGLRELCKLFGKLPIMLNDIKALKRFDWNRHKSIIFDDVNLRRFDREKVLALMDSNDEKTISFSKSGLVYIPEKVFRIFITNKSLIESLGPTLGSDKAILKRIKEYEVLQPLGKKPLIDFLEQNPTFQPELSDSCKADLFAIKKNLPK